MGSMSTQKKKLIIDVNEMRKDDADEIEEIKIIENKPEIAPEEEEKNQEERIKDEERKKKEMMQNILQKINEEELIIKIKLSQEEFVNYIIKFFEEFVQIFYSLPKKNAFTALVLEFNKKYIYTFNLKEYPDIPIKNNFFDIFKFSTIVVVCLVFLSKDGDLYKKYVSKIKEPVEKFIYSIINLVGRNILRTKIINVFVKNFKKVKRGPIFCINDIIKILFTTGKNAAAYKNLKNALNQILNNITTEPIDEVVTKINESVLFFYNASSYNSTQNSSMTATIRDNKEQNNNIKKSKTVKTDPKKEKEKIEEKKNDKKEEEQKNDKVEISEPFITEPMTKDFCLVLDIDETISHTMRLSFGNYFLLRPGVIHLIKKLYHFFEIDIFTAAIKRYADNIVDKLDPNDIYINYRFYREHCIYEGTKTVKKLVRIGRELNKIIFVDNIKYNAKYNMDNLYHVSSWKDNVYDNEMIKLQDLLIDIIVHGTYKDDIRKGFAGKDDQEQVQVQVSSI